MGVFDSLNEAPGCTDYNAKKNQHFSVAEKIRKKPKKLKYFQKLPFWWVFLIFFLATVEF